MAKKVELRCPKCDSTQIYFRVKSQDYQCQKCGYAGKVEGRK